MEFENVEMDPDYRYNDGSYLASFHHEFVEFEADKDPYDFIEFDAEEE